MTAAADTTKVSPNWRCLGCERVCSSARCKYICSCEKEKVSVCKDCYRRLGGDWEAWEAMFAAFGHEGRQHSVLDHDRDDISRLSYALQAKEHVWETILEQLRSPVGPIGATVTCGDYLLFMAVAVVLGILVSFAPVSLATLTLIFYWLILLVMQDMDTFMRCITTPKADLLIVPVVATCLWVFFSLLGRQYPTQFDAAAMWLVIFTVTTHTTVVNYCKIDVSAAVSRKRRSKHKHHRLH